MQDHEIDTALLATPVEDSDFDEIPLYDEPFWIAYPREHAFYTHEHIRLRDLDREHLLLAEGHCLAEQAMAVCRLSERHDQGELADLRAASLESLIPALVMGGAWTSDSGVAAQPLDIADASRRVSLVLRRSFPCRAAVAALGQVILAQLPNSVHPVDGRRHRQRARQPE